MVEVFCDNIASSVSLPDIGTWVAVRVTAVFNPGHFWVQFPYGTEPIEKRIMTGMLSPKGEGGGGGGGRPHLLRANSLLTKGELTRLPCNSTTLPLSIPTPLLLDFNDVKI